jgi:hypothetical protein
MPPLDVPADPLVGVPAGRVYIVEPVELPQGISSEIDPGMPMPPVDHGLPGGEQLRAHPDR